MWKKRLVRSVLGIACLSASPALAHVPYVEWRDFTVSRPFNVSSIEQSIAVYSWLEVGALGRRADDVDVYRFDVDEPVSFYAEVIVPVCPEYGGFEPWFALVGPDLPQPTVPLPVAPPPGYGALVAGRDVIPPDRESFFEPFGGKSYYQGPALDESLTTAGAYYVLYWDPRGKGGDYVAVLGREERFRFFDILRALFWTPKIRRNEELHVRCDTGGRATP